MGKPAHYYFDYYNRVFLELARHFMMFVEAL